ncbi:MAG TPA: dual specificity protein phosphatase [Gemmata sp.]
MRPVHGYSLWIGSVGDIRNLRSVLSAGIEAVVDLALNEPVPTLTRDLVYCRFPLVDGAGNAPWVLRAAVETVAGLVRGGVPTLVFCGAGMSRSPTIAAAALSCVCDLTPIECLALTTGNGPSDISAGLWNDVVAVLSTATASRPV